jgi:hypothetical protein
MIAIPPVYLPPFGTPLYWGDEQSGVLPKAVRASITSRCDATSPCSQQALETVRTYLQYVINAPCWQARDPNDLARLRQEITRVRSTDELENWIEGCLELDIDPL